MEDVFLASITGEELSNILSALQEVPKKYKEEIVKVGQLLEKELQGKPIMFDLYLIAYLSYACMKVAGDSLSDKAKMFKILYATILLGTLVAEQEKEGEKEGGSSFQYI